jgi:uncharacterized protein (DUF1499 family)
MNYNWLAVISLIVALPIIGIYLMSFMARRPANLGVKDGKLAPCPNSPNCVSTQAEDAAHRMEPIRFTGSANDAKAKLKQALREIPRTATVAETEDYLHAECTSLIFRFVDDVEFWIDEPAQAIHFRSASRIGKSDFGVNRARMETIRSEFEKN